MARLEYVSYLRGAGEEMAVDIVEGGEETVRVDGPNCFYMLSVVSGDGLEVSVFDTTPADLGELRDALHGALADKYQVVLLRTDASPGVRDRWHTLDPKRFAERLPKP